MRLFKWESCTLDTSLDFDQTGLISIKNFKLNIHKEANKVVESFFIIVTFQNHHCKNYVLGDTYYNRLTENRHWVYMYVLNV